MGGPIWTAPMHDQKFVENLINLIEESELNTKKRLLGVLSVIREELHDVPLYYVVDQLLSTVRANTIPMMAFR